MVTRCESDFITYKVAVSVVDVLEMVGIDHGDRKFGAASLGTGEFFVQSYKSARRLYTFVRSS